MADKKTDARREKLLRNPKNGYDVMSDKEVKAMESYCTEYRAYMDNALTEREAVKTTIALAEKEGFVCYKPGMKLKAGDRVYTINRAKSIILAVIGKQPLSAGFNLLASHVDAPRLDLKPNPVYESDELCYFKTHYYGGIKKYQWTALPLALTGIVFDGKGKGVDIRVGFEPGDPVLYITDLLPHLAADQMKKTMAEGISGEELNALIGSRPDSEEGSDRVKLAVLALLNKKYGITEVDFQTAELSLVPALPSRDVGFDGSMMGAYGHDDRVCSYAAVKAVFGLKKPERTALALLADKEEIGSEGVTGMKSQYFDWFVGDMCKTQGVDLRDCFAQSFCLSGDVCNANDPTFPSVSEKNNTAKFNYGVAICKYTGRGGKGGTSDAGAETMAKLRALFDKGEVLWQTTELGKVDQGGGGTVAVYLAERNIEVVDAGVPVLSMHAPVELVSKVDCYMTYKAYKAIVELN